MIKSGYCKSISDIKVFESGTWVINRTDKCECGCKKAYQAQHAPTKASMCKEWCDHTAIAGSAWCARAFKRLDCQVGCLSAVELIKKWICYPCCESGDYYKTCVKPFEDIVSYMGNPCDPYWD